MLQLGCNTQKRPYFAIRLQSKTYNKENMGGPRLYMSALFPCNKGTVFVCQWVVSKLNIGKKLTLFGSVTAKTPPSKICFCILFTTLALMIKWCIWYTWQPSCSFSQWSVCSSLIFPSYVHISSTRHTLPSWWWCIMNVDNNTDRVAIHKLNM